MSISVKVVRIPGTVKEVGLEDGSTVAQALAAAGLTTAQGEGLQVNGSPCDNNTVLNDGDSIIIAKGAKGN